MSTTPDPERIIDHLVNQHGVKPWSIYGDESAQRTMHRRLHQNADVEHSHRNEPDT